MDDIKRKKDYLFKYKNAIQCENRIKEKLLDIDTKLTASIQSVSYSNEGSSTNASSKAPYVRLIEKKDEYERRLERTHEKSERIKDEILSVIDKVNNPMYCEILESYFIEFKSVEDICESIDRTNRQWYRLYKKAILSIDI